MSHLKKDVSLHIGDCLDVLDMMPDNSVDAIVTDPPYGLTANKKGGSGVASVNLESPYGRSRIGTGNGPGGFMGMAWDSSVPSVEIWVECLRVLKPGGHLLAFAGTRTQHRMAVAIEDAGFEIRDLIAWVYGSGFPKSHNVANSIDKAHGASNRGAAIASGSKFHPTTGEARASGAQLPKYAARTQAGRGWEGWGTALKPALEPITVARKPLAGTVAANVLAHGTGAINVDACRVEGGARPAREPGRKGGFADVGVSAGSRAVGETTQGRWPANLIHDGSDEPADLLGDAARFFYCAKASKADRNDGARNPHPTVKPTALMRYLCRLVTPPGGVVLDPFMGSGSTGRGAVLEGFRFIGIDAHKPYVEIARARIDAVRSTEVDPFA